MRIVIATVTTAHFEFTAVGRNATDAKAALQAGWMEHCNQYPEADTHFMNTLILGGDVAFLFIEPGHCARDGEVISV
jgi:hypothetical protein